MSEFVLNNPTDFDPIPTPKLRSISPEILQCFNPKIRGNIFPTVSQENERNCFRLLPHNTDHGLMTFVKTIEAHKYSDRAGIYWEQRLNSVERFATAQEKTDVSIGLHPEGFLAVEVGCPTETFPPSYDSRYPYHSGVIGFLTMSPTEFRLLPHGNYPEIEEYNRLAVEDWKWGISKACIERGLDKLSEMLGDRPRKLIKTERNGAPYSYYRWNI